MCRMGTGAGLESARERDSREGGQPGGRIVAELACSALERGLSETLAVVVVAARTAMSISLPLRRGRWCREIRIPSAPSLGVPAPDPGSFPALDEAGQHPGAWGLCVLDLLRQGEKYGIVLGQRCGVAQRKETLDRLATLVGVPCLWGACKVGRRPKRRQDGIGGRSGPVQPYGMI